MNIKVYTLKSFAKTEGGGNPAGVVLDADSLSVEDMQKIPPYLRNFGVNLYSAII